MKKWRTKQMMHQGLPLLIRYPECCDFNDLSRFPNLLVITHRFSEVSANGLPDPEYNEHLLSFDREIRDAVERGNQGTTALIETFGGKRHYYIYVACQNHVEEALARVLPRYPSESLTWLVRPDPDWGFWNRYSKEFSLSAG
jgi:hypothetical protein